MVLLRQGGLRGGGRRRGLADGAGAAFGDGDAHGAGVEVREYLAAEPHGGDDQHARELGGAVGRDGHCAAVGRDEEADRDGGGSVGARGAFQDLPVHLRTIDYLVSR